MGRKEEKAKVTFGTGTVFNGTLRFKESLCIKGKFKGTIEATGEASLIVDKDAIVEADKISVTSLIVHGTVIAPIVAENMVDMFPGAKVRGDVTTARLRIADEVVFEGQCNMTKVDKDIEIFSRPIPEIKTELQRNND